MRQKTLLKIIGLMRKGIDKGLTIFDISKKLKIGYRPAYNHISEMEKKGIIKITKVGSAKQCLLNPENPSARHLLESLDMATKESDIDLLFIVSNLKNKRLREEIERESASYQYSYNAKVSPLITDIGEFKKMLKSKDLNVGKEAREYGISLYGHELFWRIIA